jgi:hypothetical protein
MTMGASTSILDGIGSLAQGIGRAGNVNVTAQAITITNAGDLVSLTFGAGDSGDVSVNVFGTLSINGFNAAPGFGTAIAADAEPGSSGNAGKVTATSGKASLVNWRHDHEQLVRIRKRWQRFRDG